MLIKFNLKWLPEIWVLSAEIFDHHAPDDNNNAKPTRELFANGVDDLQM
jgi:hypothetical protein